MTFENEKAFLEYSKNGLTVPEASAIMKERIYNEATVEIRKANAKMIEALRSNEFYKGVE
jgi:hypothetical protein